MSKPALIELHASLNHLAVLRRFVHDQALLLGLDESEAYDLMLAMTEAVTNILLHGYPNQEGWIAIEMFAEANGAMLVIRDAAPGFDPTQAGASKLKNQAPDRPSGGMGIAWIRQFTDRMQYQPLASGGNQLLLFKMRKAKGTEVSDDNHA